MLSERTIRRELDRVKQELNVAAEDHRDQHALYGAMQALEWALGKDAMAPAKSFGQGRRSVALAQPGDRLGLSLCSEDLLSPEQKRALHDDLAALAQQRRHAEANARNVVLD